MFKAVASMGAYISDIIILSYIQHKPLLLSWLKKLHTIRLRGAGFNLTCIKNNGSAPSMEVIQDDYIKVYTPLGATALILVNFS